MAPEGDPMDVGEVAETLRGESLQPGLAPNVPATSNKLDHEQQVLICQALAEYCTLEQAAERLVAAGGPRLNISTVAWYRHSRIWEPMIQELRGAWTARLGDCAGANKAIRLRELWRLYDGAVGGKHPARRDALACLEAIRREMEGPDRAGSASSEIRITLGAQGVIEAQPVASMPMPPALPVLAQPSAPGGLLDTSTETITDAETPGDPA